MLGLHFEDCNKFGLTLHFENCILNNSTFYKLKLKQTNFINSQIKEADFGDCDLTSAIFENCNLEGTIFDNTILEKADLRTSYNYIIDPENNRLKNAKFSLSGVNGLLNKYNIEIY